MSITIICEIDGYRPTPPRLRNIVSACIGACLEKGVNTINKLFWITSSSRPELSDGRIVPGVPPVTKGAWWWASGLYKKPDEIVKAKMYHYSLQCSHSNLWK